LTSAHRRGWAYIEGEKRETRGVSKKREGKIIIPKVPLIPSDLKQTLKKWILCEERFRKTKRGACLSRKKEKHRQVMKKKEEQEGTILAREGGAGGCGDALKKGSHAAFEGEGTVNLPADGGGAVTFFEKKKKGKKMQLKSGTVSMGKGLSRLWANFVAREEGEKTGLMRRRGCQLQRNKRGSQQ